MTPAAVVEGPSRSASAIVADTTRGYHILRIDGYSLTKATPTGECIKSHPFTVGGHGWYINYYPNGNKEEVNDYISLFLHLVKIPTNEKEVKVQFQFRFISDLSKKPATSEDVNIFGSQSGWGYTKLIRRTDLEESEHLKDDSFTIPCDIVVINDFRAEEEEAEVTTPGLPPVPPSDLHQHLANLLLTEKGADVVFEVGTETFAVHRSVLAARSPVFNAELFGTMKESNTGGVIRIDDMEAQVFKALLYFVYTDSLPKPKKEEEGEEDVMFQHLLVAADKYGLERLKLICEHRLCRYIDVGSVATILTLAEQHHCHGLKKVCFGFLRSSANLKAVMATDDFDHLSKSCPSVLKELLTMLSTSHSVSRNL